MQRIELLNLLARRWPQCRYLEIGVRAGKTLFAVDAAIKTAVDPQFKLRSDWLESAIARDPRNASIGYLPLTSDDYYTLIAPRLTPEQQPHLVFVDGLHTHEQALHDALNALRFIADGGIVVLHDANPTTPSRAWPATSVEQARLEAPDFDGYWSGEVWKAVVDLRRELAHHQCWTIDSDHGLAIIEAGSPVRLEAPPASALSYRDLADDRERLLGLVGVSAALTRLAT